MCSLLRLTRCLCAKVRRNESFLETLANEPNLKTVAKELEVCFALFDRSLVRVCTGGSVRFVTCRAHLRTCAQTLVNQLHSASHSRKGFESRLRQRLHDLLREMWTTAQSSEFDFHGRQVVTESSYQARATCFDARLAGPDNKPCL
mgnify:CR=1 FL=1